VRGGKYVANAATVIGGLGEKIYVALNVVAK
jgi:hypothetical protein